VLASSRSDDMPSICSREPDSACVPRPWERLGYGHWLLEELAASSVALGLIRGFGCLGWEEGWLPYAGMGPR
jgi:hypothetical protein